MQSQSQPQRKNQSQNQNRDPSSSMSSVPSSLFHSAPVPPSSYLSTLTPSLGSFLYGHEQQITTSNLEDENRISNPFSGMGMPDDQYTMMLQNVMSGNNFMSGLEGVATSTSGASASVSSPSSSSISSPPLLSQQVMGSINGRMNASLGMTNVIGMSIRGEKRPYDNCDDIGPSGSNGREKRSRFEVIE